MRPGGLTPSALSQRTQRRLTGVFVRATEALEPALQPALVVEDLIETFGQRYADIKTPLVAPGSPWENRSVESFNEELR